MSQKHPFSKGRECTCPDCEKGNGGLDYCARCRFYDCTPEESFCDRDGDTDD